MPLFLAIWFVDQQMFAASAILTALIFLGIGVVRGHIAKRRSVAAGIETLLIGGTAASLAYVVGVWLRGFAVG